MPTLRVLWLHCNSTEDITGADETVLTVRGNQFHKWGPVAVNNSGESRDQEINLDVPFSTRARMELTNTSWHTEPTPVFHARAHGTVRL